METAAEKWARVRGARVLEALALRAAQRAVARHVEAARVARVALEEAQAAQRLEDEGEGPPTRREGQPSGVRPRVCPEEGARRRTS